MRGEHIGHRTALYSQHRFIPAHAGNTMTSERAQARRSVHPRARGEHAEAAHDELARHGSSPRTRGTRFLESIEKHIFSHVNQLTKEKGSEVTD